MRSNEATEEAARIKRPIREGYEATKGEPVG
jgi:hypothetical protein